MALSIHFFLNLPCCHVHASKHCDCDHRDCQSKSSLARQKDTVLANDAQYSQHMTFRPAALTVPLVSRTMTTRHASTLAKRAKPEQFLQTIVLSNGATYKIRTTSPRTQIRLTKDTRNHPLWNPEMLKEGLRDESEQLSKFQKRFGVESDLADLSWIESDEAVSITMKKAVASGGYSKKAAAAKGKKK